MEAVDADGNEGLKRCGNGIKNFGLGTNQRPRGNGEKEIGEIKSSDSNPGEPGAV